MRRIRVVDTINYPPLQAERLLDEYLGRRRASGGEICVSLRLDLAEFGIGGELAIVHDVIMRIRKNPSDEASQASYRIDWTPSSGGPYPRFLGTMNALPARDGRTTTLEVTGDYEPPFGAVGAAFDAVVGKKIAAGTLRAFVREIASEISPNTSSSSRQ